MEMCEEREEIVFIVPSLLIKHIPCGVTPVTNAELLATGPRVLE
jgi:hypothetical protein